ncbi:MAG: TonB family protein [Halieaceae bacterium]
MNLFKFILFSIVVLIEGCATPYQTCHSYSECPDSLYSWEFGEKKPQALEEAKEKDIPYLLEATPPYYPKDAWDEKIEGEATFAYSVNSSGEVIDIVVVNSQPEGVFDAAGKEALKYSRYTRTENGATGYERRFTWSIQH